MAGQVHIRERGGDPRLAGARLTIDLRALQTNYRALARVGAPARTAGVVKADAYGLGIAETVGALSGAGCDTFFVALPAEGLLARQAAPQARIFVLNGLFSREIAGIYGAAHLIPVLNSSTDAAIWEGYCGASAAAHPCAVNVDTGMNRLGMTLGEAAALAEENALTRALKPVLLMSHLACADDPGHPMNRRQLEMFDTIRGTFGGIDASLANSAGVLLGRDYHFDLTRPGIAVYGASPSTRVSMRTVVTAEARVAQIRRAKAGETVSYGATTILSRDSIIAVAAAGYADGYHRAASATGVPMREFGPGGHGHIHGHRVPILGRVTMDITMFDVTDLGPGAVVTGDFIELFGPNIPVKEAAHAAGTVAYEMLTGLGRRYHRSYVSTEGTPS